VSDVVVQPFEHRSGSVSLVGERWIGGESGVVVILAHGGGQTRYSWGRTAERLARAGHTAITYDARGHGDSSWDPHGDYSLDAFAGDLLEVIGTVDRPPILVGASLGGTAALCVAGEHPGVAAGLVLVDVVVDVNPEGAARIVAFMREHAADGFASLDEVADAVAAYNPLRRRRRNPEGLRKNVRLRDDDRWYWHWDPGFLQIGDEPRRQASAERLRDAARHVQVPTLIVRGGRSDVVDDAGIAEMRRLIPETEVINVAEAGHMVAGDDNDVFAVGLLDFVDRVPSVA
jgi:pimeloyl-ACP methyl ester carboxylesterase